MSNIFAQSIFGKYIAAGEGGFTPADISDLALWLDASDESTITESGGSVSQWDDKSGNDYHVTQGTGANQPTTGTRTVNGLNALDFDGTSSYFDADSGIYSIPSGNNTYFVVLDLDNPATGQRLLNGTVGAGTRWGAVIDPSGNRLRCVNNTSFTSTDVSVTFSTGVQLASFRREGSTVDGFHNDATSTDSTGVSVTLDDASIGRFNPAGSDYLTGAICEILVFSRALTVSELNQIRSYLADKWGGSWTEIT